MSSGLRGLTFLVVDDEPLIAMDIAMALEDVGAKVTTTNTLKDAVLLAEHDGLAGAIVDHSLGDGDSTVLRGRLKERGIPFLVYSGFEIEGEPYLSKPANTRSTGGRLSQTCPEPDLVCGSM